MEHEDLYYLRVENEFYSFSTFPICLNHAELQAGRNAGRSTLNIHALNFEKRCFNNGTTTIVTSQSPDPVKRPRSERISRTKRNGERIFCFEIQRKKYFFSQHIKNLVLLVFDFMLWTLLLYQFLLPITFLRLMLFFLFLSSWKKIFLTNNNKANQLYTHTHVRIIPVLTVQNHFILKTLQLWKERKTNSSAGIQVLYLIVLKIMHDARRRNPVGK